MNKQEYNRFLKTRTPNSPIFKDCLWAFLVGGGICCIGQGISDLLSLWLHTDEVKLWVPICMVFLGAFFTALGVYDKLAKHAGGGTIIPITGFANSVASAAIEFKHEGFILGLGAKIFTIAGPVIAYGTLASVVYGIIYWIFKMI
ncbi:MAG: SpoVA/SpoVAEb family sporulation membrane protein [Clostridia bacterium]|nr:SpoVA/SpoVAEb family sporulation membrane protein [Clostridia bacterium]